MGGMLCGLGSVFGGGGYMGHMICGLPRLSRRSIFASILMGISAVCTYKYKLISTIEKTTEGKIDLDLPINVPFDYYILGTLLIPFISFIFSEKKSLRSLFEYLSLFLVGFLAGLGLMVGGQGELKDILQIFSYDKKWDPTFLVFSLTAIFINIFSLNYLILTK